MVALLALGLVLTRVLGRTTPKVSKQEAVAVARPNVHFTPQGYNIRLVRQGIPPGPSGPSPSGSGRPEAVATRGSPSCCVDANSGRVMQVRRTT